MAKNTENDPNRAWRRFDDEKDFNGRPGALDRRWGYGSRLTPQPGRGQRRGSQPREDKGDEHNAPDDWVYQKAWMKPGPFSGIGPHGYQRSDERIMEDVCERLSQHAQIDASDIDVEVNKGEVTLRGTVKDRHMKRLTELNVEMIPGVVDVNNELRLPGAARSQPEEPSQQERSDVFPGGPTPTGNAS